MPWSQQEPPLLWSEAQLAGSDFPAPRLGNVGDAVRREEDPGMASRVMIVEDDERIRELVGVVLTEEGYDVIPAGNGAEAMDQIRNSGHPDVIFLDMWMPIMDGCEFSRAYAKTPGPHAPVVFLTAESQPALPGSGLEADFYLPKPFDLEDLIQLAAKCSRLKRSAA